jgi:hypothetical protein
MKFFTFLISLLTICLYSCNKDCNSNSNSGKFLLTYSEGSNWITYSCNATIDQDGKLTINYLNSLTNTNNKSVYQIEAIEIIVLKEKMKKLSAINLSDNYGFDNINSPKDLPVKFISYQCESKTDSTSLYFPSDNELPSELEYFLNDFVKVINKYDTLRN